MIESDEVANQSSSSSDDTVDTDELPDLVEIDKKEKPAEKETTEEVVEDSEEEKGKIRVFISDFFFYTASKCYVTIYICIEIQFKGD